jgi:hypothetical protein
MSLVTQIRNNQLAIISLLVALAALSYNTWRNELTEQNRNIRNAGFEMLLHIANLQRITYLAHYDQDMDAGNPRKGWTEVLVLQDLAMLMPPNAHDRTTELAQTWQENWENLGANDAAVQAIDSATDALRTDILAELVALE